MPLSIPRLRRWFVLAAVALSLVVAGVYLHRRSQVREVLKHIPGKMDIDIQQTAEGFKVSKSEGGRTLFTIQASKVVQFKLGGRAELRDVTITLYGRDSSRYDQIYGDDFGYDPKSGDVTAKGEVRIDLEANPKGLLKPDQSVPTELKNPIHLVTRDLMFNQKTGNALTKAKVELRMPQATGSAVGVHYTAEDNVLTLDSQVDLVLAGSGKAKLTATRGVISKTPRQVVLDHPRLSHGPQRMDAQKATLYLRDDNTVDHVLASDGVQADLPGDAPIHARAAQAEFKVNPAQDGLSTAVLSGDVQLDAAGERPARANAGRVVLDFAGKNLLSKIRAEDNVKLVEFPAATPDASAANSQQVEITAPAIDFVLAHGKHLDHAETSSPAQIAVLPATNDNSHTLVTAGKFKAKFDDRSRLSAVHGAPDARITSSTPGQPEHTSTSQTMDVAFRPAGGIDSIVQQGDVAYTDGERQARANRARYTPADQMLELTGSPRITDQGLTTTARIVRMNRASGDATAEGQVKSTYSDLREQPNGALLAAASPIHITARSMTVHRTTAVATYAGDARIWQDANVVEAPTLQFDRDHRSVVAQGDGQPVSTVLVQVDKKGNATPISITSARLTYTDDQHRAHFEGGVTARGADATITADHLDAFMIPRSQASSNQSFKGQGQLDRIIAEGNVVIQEPARRAQGEKLVYTAAEEKFALTGGLPSIFDAEHGKTTGDSLTFYKRDDRVLVEGRDTSPTVTQTRVAR
ncbi:MAG TPA: LPS export ABC transporter periplasmic protein LptC [Terriglobales bacterium]|nr:LPS export ABC transporter periplasmic protein LptC [Terriglobales bacterium]